MLSLKRTYLDKQLSRPAHSQQITLEKTQAANTPQPFSRAHTRSSSSLQPLLSRHISHTRQVRL